jgi:transposase, IS6 family
MTTRRPHRAPIDRSAFAGFCPRRDSRAAHRFVEQAIDDTKVSPSEVVTDRAPTYPVVLEDLLPAALHRTDRSANNGIVTDRGRL